MGSPRALSGRRSWYDRLSAARRVHTYASPLSPSKAPYSPSGRTQALVWPYMVSGLSVAASKKTPPGDCAATAAKRPGKSFGSVEFSSMGNAFSLISVYSWGPTPSPVARSWSAHGWPSSGEKTA